MLVQPTISGVQRRSTPAPAASTAALQLSRCCRQIGTNLRQQSRLVVDSSAPDTDQQVDEVVAEAVVRAGWDPQGLLPPLEGPVDHFSRRARQRKQQQQGEQGQDKEIQQQDDQQQQQVEAAVPPAAAPAAASSAYTTAVQQQQRQQQQQAEQPQPQPQQQEQRQADSTGTVRVSQPATAAFAPTDPVHRIPALWLKQGGIPASDAAAYDRPAFLERLATKFIPIDLDFPGVRIVNFDPAILTIEGFMSPEECEQWQQAALDSGGAGSA